MNLQRYKWLTTASAFSVKTLAKGLRGFPFTENAQDGFIVDRVREDQLEARFIQNRTARRTFLDPFGIEVSYDRISYAETSFRVNKAYPELELINAARGSQAFAMRLGQASGFTLGLESVRVHVQQWAEELQARYPDQFTVRAAHVSNVKLGRDVLGKASATGTGEVLNDLLSMLGDRDWEVDKLQVSFAIQRSQVQVTLSSDGSARVSIPASNDLIRDIRAALPNPSAP